MGKCPFCGAVRIDDGSGYSVQFDCLTCSIEKDGWDRGDECYENQITTLQAQLADWEERLALWLDYSNYSSDEFLTSGQLNIIPGRGNRYEAAKALKAKGEI